MQAQQQQGPLPSGDAGQPAGPLGRHLYSQPEMKNNYGVLQFNRIFVSLVAGIVTGIAGITGFKGFAAYLVGHALMAGALLAKAGFRPQTYFEPWSTLAVSGVAASTELLTFILAWTLAHNTVYLF